jgi:hypothetical protein
MSQNNFGISRRKLFLKFCLHDFTFGLEFERYIQATTELRFSGLTAGGSPDGDKLCNQGQSVNFRSVCSRLLAHFLFKDCSPSPSATQLPSKSNIQYRKIGESPQQSMPALSIVGTNHQGELLLPENLGC